MKQTEQKDQIETVQQYSYSYDGVNRRIKKHIDSQSPAEPDGIDKYEHFFYNTSWQVLEMRDTTTENDGPESLQPDYQYVWSARYIDAPVLRDKNTDSDGLCDDQRVYYFTDANFNMTALGDTSGGAIERYVYDPYGKLTIYAYHWAWTLSTSTYGPKYLYTGREYDAETGLYHYRNRHYHAELGRFISRDPIGYDGGDVNLYRYVGNNAVSRIDPWGDRWWYGVPTPADIAICKADCARTGRPYVKTFIIRWEIHIPYLCTIWGRTVACECGPLKGRCKPCFPAVGTIGYRVDVSPPSKPHSPHPDTHTHLYTMNQSPYPVCRCFWKKGVVVAGSTPPPGAVPMTPASGGGPIVGPSQVK